MSASRRRIHWTCWHPSAYNDVIFNALAREPAWNLMLHFRERGLPTHPWRTELRPAYDLRFAQRFAGLDLRLLRLVLTDAEALFVAGGWGDPTSLALLNGLMLAGRRFAVWTDTPDLTARRHPLKQAARAAWLRSVFQRAIAVMGTGQPALDALEDMGCPRDKLLNLPYYVDLMSFSPSDSTRPEIVFVSSGRLDRVKGYDLALDALAEVFRGQSTAFRYRIAGVGQEIEALKAQATELGLADRVEFIGWLEPDDLPAFYRTGDIMLHPARREPYGVAILEAMASGVIVIGSDAVNAVRDRVVSGRNGFVHRNDDAADLAAAIRKALADRDAWPERKRKARETAEAWPSARAVETLMEVMRRGTRSSAAP